MTFSRNFLDIKSTKLPNEVKNLVDSDELMQAVLDEVERNVPKIAGKELGDVDGRSEIEDYSGLEMAAEEKREYLLVMDFLKSIGLKFTPAVLQYESQHPEIELDRKEFASELGLNAASKESLLVQLFQERLDSIQKINK